ncbi:MOSC domain-containing protein [Youngiibacter multivorans]|uniref:MOSC domain-containing protein YiiM n=1 Tax=Youngiibacter multivorans TaxID=937251 RepID=A0ABS4FZ72_9CLOT|nr:MOSC domain-containing protein [Youngiibacter multivorans]MBP1917608.1 MOSC domain-containing protein YiiM [Youngiibacter multivorans]
MELVELRIKRVRGIPAEAADEAVLVEGFGIEGDVFGGKAEREISLFDESSRLYRYEERKDGFCTVRFAENLLTRGIDYPSTSCGTRLAIGDAIIEITKSGKECHPECPVFKREGNCGMHLHGAYSKVIRGGTVHPGDQIKVIPDMGDEKA